jgi:hypothetical protein
VGRKGSGNDFDIEPGQSLPLKSLSPRQSPGWNDPYRIVEFSAISQKRVITSTSQNIFSNRFSIPSVIPKECIISPLNGKFLSIKAVTLYPI